jgi:hypothetical protein
MFDEQRFIAVNFSIEVMRWSWVSWVMGWWWI